jgi:hypothetical protein
MTGLTTMPETVPAAPGGDLRPGQTTSDTEFGIVYSHASEATGSLVAGGYAAPLEVASAAVRVLAAQPGIEAVFVTRTEGTDWADDRGRTPRQIIHEDWANPRDEQHTVDVHLSRSFGGPDQYTADCPCAVAPCGLAISSANNCPQHANGTKTMRSAHSAINCPGVPS